MLKNIPGIVNADLLYTLAAMGHGDEICIVDQNYPAYSAGPKVIHTDGVDTTALITAILALMPLDTFVDEPLLYMKSVDSDDVLPVHVAAQDCATAAEQRHIRVAGLDRQSFYARARNAQAIVTTGETRAYGCFLLTKGVLP